jgi:hypothetical protein
MIVAISNYLYQFVEVEEEVRSREVEVVGYYHYHRLSLVIRWKWLPSSISCFSSGISSCSSSDSYSSSRLTLNVYLQTKFTYRLPSPEKIKERMFGNRLTICKVSVNRGRIYGIWVSQGYQLFLYQLPLLKKCDIPYPVQGRIEPSSPFLNARYSFMV